MQGRAWQRLLARLDRTGRIDCGERMADGTFASARKRGDAEGGNTGKGTRTKVMSMIDGHGLLLSATVTSAEELTIPLPGATIAASGVVPQGRPDARVAARRCASCEERFAMNPSRRRSEFRRRSLHLMVSSVLAALVVLVPGLPRSQADEASAAKRPNIVLIMADDFGYECVGADGGASYKTPVLDRLAADGVRFEHCYAQPLCTPTRAQLMTGLSNVRNYVSFGKLAESQTTFAHLFRKAGYATGIFGKWQLGTRADIPQHFGFDEACLWQHTRRPSRYASPGVEVDGVAKDFPGGYGPDVVCDHACRFVERHKNRPFLLYWPMILTHCPFEPTPDSPDWDPKSPGADSYKGNPKYFPDMVAYCDKLVGRLLKTLESAGVRDDTLVLFLGDNGTDQPIVSKMRDGTAVAGGKGKTTEAGMRVPCIASWPGRTPPGRVCRDLVDTTDFLPTMCDAAGIPLPDTLRPDGRSFLPQLRGEPGLPREWLYCWYSRDGGPGAKEFARTHRWKLYRTGEFYDLTADVLEARPLEEAALNDEARQVRTRLEAVFPLYADARGSALHPADREKKPGANGNGAKKATGTKKAKKKAAPQ